MLRLSKFALDQAKENARKLWDPLPHLSGESHLVLAKIILRSRICLGRTSPRLGDHIHQRGEFFLFDEFERPLDGQANGTHTQRGKMASAQIE